MLKVFVQKIQHVKQSVKGLVVRRCADDDLQVLVDESDRRMK